MDTNVVIDYLGGRFSTTLVEFIDTIVDDTPNISIITKIELLGFNTSDEVLEIFKNFMNDSNVIGLTDEVKNRTIEIRKSFKVKLPAAIIAATDLTYDLILTNSQRFRFQEY